MNGAAARAYSRGLRSDLNPTKFARDADRSDLDQRPKLTTLPATMV